MMGLRTIPDFARRGGAKLEILLLLALLPALTCGDSDTTRPDSPEDPTPAGPPISRISALDWPLLSTEVLLVRGLAGAAPVASDGTFPDLLDPDAGRQPLVVSLGDSIPLFLGFVRPDSTKGFELGCESTIAAILELDPFLWGCSGEAAAQLVASCASRSSDIAQAVRSKIMSRDLGYLLETTAPNPIEAAGALLRSQAGSAALCRGAWSDSLHPGEGIRLESSPRGSGNPWLVNPFAIQYGVGIYIYGTDAILARFASGRSIRSDPNAPPAPARAELVQPDGRYRMVVHSGERATPADPISPAHLAFRLNAAAAASSWLESVGPVAEPPWVDDPARFTVEGLALADSVRAAWVSGEAGRFVAALLRLLQKDRDRLLGSEHRELIDALIRIGIAQAGAVAALPPGPFLCDLAGAPIEWRAQIRIRGGEVTQIDPPELVRPPEDLSAAFDQGVVRLTWADRSSNEDRFVVLRKPDGGQEAALAWVAEDVTVFEDPFLDSHLGYEYRVYAENAYAQSEASEIARAVTGEVVDVRPPSRVSDLAIDGTAFESVGLVWTAPGDDGSQGQAAGYEVRYSRDPIDSVSWDAATPVEYPWPPRRAGAREFLLVEGLSAATTYHFALKSVDESANRSALSNVAVGSAAHDNPDAHWMPGFAPVPFGQGLDGNVQAMILYQGDLVVAGNFTQAGDQDVGYIARWDGNRWHPLGSGTDSWIYALAVHDGDLIAGGTFTRAGGAAARFIARWDGSSWSPFGPGMDNVVRALIEHDGLLYAGGAFHRAGGFVVNGIARWNGVGWDSLGSGVNNQVLGLGAFEGDLIVGGDFSRADGVPGTSQIARWDGTRWSGFDGGMDLDYVWSFAAYEGDLIVGGQFKSAGGAPAANIARWDGERWHPFGSGSNGWVHGLAVYNGDLIASGWFTTIDGVDAPHVARWNGVEWSPLGAGIGGGVVNCVLVDGGSIYFGGWFTEAGRIPSARIARWKD